MDRLGGVDRSLALGGQPSVWLFVGVNGVGKTTTIGKLGAREVAQGLSVVSPLATRSGLRRLTS
ncbi:MAG: hypothetical protein Ct9H300mP12_15970 [Acidimicrobiales bacterium]|nr:MAG: hypothetical protein Ct9H300mP12_15970 [Acidimicrobiales bacterium]